MPDEIERLASEYGLTLCMQCGKCVAVCPMSKVSAEFSYEVSPRGVVDCVNDYVNDGVVDRLNGYRQGYSATAAKSSRPARKSLPPGVGVPSPLVLVAVLGQARQDEHDRRAAPWRDLRHHRADALLPRCHG